MTFEQFFASLNQMLLKCIPSKIVLFLVGWHFELAITAAQQAEIGNPAKIFRKVAQFTAKMKSVEEMRNTIKTKEQNCLLKSIYFFACQNYNKTNPLSLFLFPPSALSPHASLCPHELLDLAGCRCRTPGPAPRVVAVVGAPGQVQAGLGQGGDQRGAVNRTSRNFTSQCPC